MNRSFKDGITHLFDLSQLVFNYIAEVVTLMYKRFRMIYLLLFVFISVVTACSSPNNTPQTKPSFNSNSFINDLNALNKNTLSSLNKSDSKNFKTKGIYDEFSSYHFVNVILTRNGEIQSYVQYALNSGYSPRCPSEFTKYPTTFGSVNLYFRFSNNKWQVNFYSGNFEIPAEGGSYEIKSSIPNRLETNFKVTFTISTNKLIVSVSGSEIEKRYDSFNNYSGTSPVCPRPPDSGNMGSSYEETLTTTADTTKEFDLITPEPTPTPTDEPSPTPSPTVTPTSTPTPEPTPTCNNDINCIPCPPLQVCTGPGPSPTPNPTATINISPNPSSNPTNDPSNPPRPTPRQSNTPNPTSTPLATATPTPVPTTTPTPKCKNDIKKINNDIDSLHNDLNDISTLTTYIQNNLEDEETEFTNQSFSVKKVTECGIHTNCDDIMPAYYNQLHPSEVSNADRIAIQIGDIAIEQAAIGIVTAGLGNLASLTGKELLYALSKPGVRDYIIKASERLSALRLPESLCPIPSYAGEVSVQATKGKSYIKDILDKAENYIKSAGKLGKKFSLPAWNQINKAWQHIFDRHMFGGSGVTKGRDLFPASFSENDVKRVIEEAYKTAKKIGHEQVDNVGEVRVTLRGFSETLSKYGLPGKIEFYFNKTTSTIETAYPKPGYKL